MGMSIEQCETMNIDAYTPYANIFFGVNVDGDPFVCVEARDEESYPCVYSKDGGHEESYEDAILVCKIAKVQPLTVEDYLVCVRKKDLKRYLLVSKRQEDIRAEARFGLR